MGDRAAGDPPGGDGDRPGAGHGSDGQGSRPGQDTPPSERFPGDALVHLAPDGARQAQLGGPDCRPLDELPDGTMACFTGCLVNNYEVRSISGQLRWERDLDVPKRLFPHLSPDATRIATGNAILAASGPVITVKTSGGADFRAHGWLDSQTVIGDDSSSTNLWLVDPGHPTQPHALGVNGKFAGLL